MSENGIERRLTTILVADLVGYSRLMAADEAGTLTQLKTHRTEVIAPKTAEFRGRVVKLMGDGILMEFGSVVDAVNFAVAVQRASVAHNAGVPENRWITYRIGINIGDIIVEGDDIYGDGVNIAARLEGLAEPGGICVARNVFNQVKAKVGVGFEDLGAQHVKNIPESVRVYRVLLHAPAAGHSPVVGSVAKRSQHWRLVAGGLAVLVIAAGIASWQRPWEPREEPALVENMAFPLPDRPSIAVLPFSNISDDPEQDYFSDGMTEDLITDLSKISGLFVIARNSSFSYKGRQVKVRQVAEELGVRYVLEGSVRRAGDQVRINAQLIDATTGGHLWAERYDGSLADVFALQDKVTASIVEALALELTPQEVQRVGQTGTASAEALDAYLLGLSHYNRGTPKDNAKAREHFQRALALDPDYDNANMALAKVYSRSTLGEPEFSRELGLSWRGGYADALRYLNRGLAGSNVDYHLLRSWVALRKYQHENAIDEARFALELSPNDGEAMAALAKALIYAGRPEEGMQFAQSAMRQNPTSPGTALYLLGLGEFALGHSDRTVELVERALKHAPYKLDYNVILAAAYAEVGRVEQARAALDSVSQGWQLVNRELNLAVAVWSHPFIAEPVVERLAEGLSVAGARSGLTGFVPLKDTYRLKGPEIESLLFGKEIKGLDILDFASWSQQRTDDGTVKHFGTQIQPGVYLGDEGFSRVDEDMLCEKWPKITTNFDMCVFIYRMPEGRARAHWGDYVMITILGPQFFSVVE